MMCFFDTSALVKYYIREAGSANVTALIQHPDSYLFISEIAHVEIRSAFYTKLRTQQIKPTELEQALQAFRESLDNFYSQPITGTLRQRAEELIEEHGTTFALRTLDAFQLATFLLLPYKGATFVSADERLVTLVQAVDFPVLNPSLT
mgnify:CR=1 FL=1